MTRAADLAKLIAGGGTITVADNSDTLTLESTDADANVGPVLNLHRNSASPADGDLTGRIVFKADDDAGNAATFARIEATATDVSNGGEDGRLDFFTAKDDAFTAALSVLGTDVGIGTTSPSQKLVVSNTSGSISSLIQTSASGTGNLLFGDTDSDTSGRVQYNHSSNFLAFYANGSERMRIDSNGNVGIGDTSPESNTNFTALTVTSTTSTGGGQVYVQSSSVNSVFGADNSSSDPKSILQTVTDHPLQIGTHNTERLRVGADGHLFATSSDTSLANLTLKKSAGDTIDYLQCRKTDNDLRIVLEGSGDVHNATGTFSAISDEKLKENIVDASSQWDDIKNIKIRNFSLKADKSSEANMIGVVAQEIEKISPNLVKERIDTDPDTGEDLGTKTKIVKYSILHTKAVKALQEAMARIETLEAKVKTLESK